jgi:UDP-N-acetylmuramoylalanine--D-glutamate ligase
MKVAILGYDVEGRVSYDYFAAQGHELEIRDQNPELSVPDGVPAVLGETYLDGLDRFDLVVRTAGLPPAKIFEQNRGIESKVTSLINEFMKASPTKNIIGVTGTKGKGTTSALITEMLKAAGKDVRLGGNIGLPPLTFLNELTAESWAVLELSSFQLIDIQTAPQIAVCLMVVPEHLNWHKDLDEYAQAKARLFANQGPDDIAVYFAKNELSEKIAAASPGRKIPYFASPGAHIENDTVTIDGQEICRTDELKLPGAHNQQNVCAAVTAGWQATQDVEAIRSVLTSFAGLPHRLEMVRELDGVRYYDDSFGTTPETAMVAVEAFKQPKIVVLGGRGKGIPFEELARAVADNNVKKVIAIGETGPEIAENLRAAGFEEIIEGGKTIEEIVEQSRQLASPGDVVLLSTACTSFDMFKNYKDRGEQFTAAVQSLA